MTARDHHHRPLLQRIAALFALFAIAATAHAAQAPVEGDPTGDTPFGETDNRTRLVDVAMDNLGHRAVAITQRRSALILGPSGSATSEIDLPGKPRTLAIDPTRQLALIGTDKRRGVRLLDLENRALLPERITTGRHIDALALSPAHGIAVALEHKRDTLHFIDIDGRRQIERLRLRGTKLTDLAIHAGHAYVINQKAPRERRHRGGNGREDDDDDDRDDDRDDDEDDRDDNGRDNQRLKGELLTIDLATREILRRTPLSKHADTLVIDPALNLAAISLRERGKVQLIDLTTGDLLHQHPLPHKITALALQPLTHQLLITLSGADQVALLDIERNTLISPYATLTEPRRAAISTRYNLALVISGEEHDTLEPLPLPAPAPALTALSPAEIIIGDPAHQEGLEITLSGGPFFDGADLHFGNERYTTDWHGFDTLTTRLPATRLDTPGEIELRIENPHPTSGPSEALLFTLRAPNPVPVLSSVEPNVIELTDPPSAATLTLGGSGFIADTTAYLGAQPLATTPLSESTLSVVIPAERLTDPGQAVITLFNPAPGGGTSAPATIQLESPGPRITGFTPSEGPAGTLVTLTGRNFDALTPANNRVIFTGSTTPAAIAYADAETLRAVVPLDTESGPITLTTADGEAVSTEPFTLQPLEAFDIQANPATTTLPPVVRPTS